MESAVWGLVGSILGAIVGAVASIATTVIQSKNADSLRSAANRDEREERKRAFQRETLVELQDALHDLCRSTVQVHIEDMAAFRKTGAWGANMLSSELNEGQRVLRRRTMLLTSRISNDDLRNRVRSLQELLTDFSMARSEDESRRLHIQMNNDSPIVLETIGSELRAQH